MAKIVCVGFDQLAKQFSDVANHSGHIARKSLFEGSGLLADKLRQATENLTTEDSRKHVTKAVLDYEKEALLNGLTVERFKTSRSLDYTQTSITFHGRANHRTEKYPDGIPTIVLARSITKGTPFRSKNRYFPNTVNRSRKQVEEKMVKVAEDEINKFIK